MHHGKFIMEKERKERKGEKKKQKWKRLRKRRVVVVGGEWMKKRG